MPTLPDQPDPKQAVEARLCAYLEGDLTGDERARIERHLANHPQHRQLLAELAAIRGWTRQLPREPAPPDLAEAFQQQVERAMLLDPAAAGRPAGRIGRRWASAAVLLLTVGAASVVAVVLTRHPGRPPVALEPRPATRPQTPPPTTADRSSVALAPPAAASPPLKVKTDDGPTLPEGPSTRGGADAGLAGGNAFGVAAPPIPAAPPPEVTAEPAASVTHALAAAGFRRPDANPVVCLVVATPVPDVARQRAVEFCLDNRLAWDGPAAVADPNTGPLADVLPSQQQPAPRLGQASKQPGRNAQNGGNAGTSASAGGGGYANADPKNSRTGGVQNNAGQDARPRAGLTQNDGVQNRYGGVGDPQNNAAQNNAAKNNATRNELTPNRAATTAPGGDAAGPLLVVRNVSPRQVRELTAVLSAAGATARAVDVPPTVTAGEQLDVTIPQLVGPGVERTNVVRVAADGTVALPMLPDPVAAAGLTAADLERRIAARYKSANLIPAATVTVLPHGATTRPAAGGLADDARITVVLDVRTVADPAGPATRP